MAWGGRSPVVTQQETPPSSQHKSFEFSPGGPTIREVLTLPSLGPSAAWWSLVDSSVVSALACKPGCSCIVPLECTPRVHRDSHGGPHDTFHACPGDDEVLSCDDEVLSWVRGVTGECQFFLTLKVTWWSDGDGLMS